MGIAILVPGRLKMLITRWFLKTLVLLLVVKYALFSIAA